jgi:hypothetical protein
MHVTITMDIALEYNMITVEIACFDYVILPNNPYRDVHRDEHDTNADKNNTIV